MQEQKKIKIYLQYLLFPTFPLLVCMQIHLHLDDRKGSLIMTSALGLKIAVSAALLWCDKSLFMSTWRRCINNENMVWTEMCKIAECILYRL